MKKLFAIAIVFLACCLHSIAASVTLTWDASAGAIAYFVYSSTEGGPFVMLGTAIQTTLTTTATAATSYYVTAVNSAGAESLPSNTVTYNPAATPPAPPTNLRVTAMSASRIDLRWTPSTDPLVTYVLIDRDGNTIATLPATQTSYVNTGLRKNHLYTYRLRVQDAGGLMSGYSNSASAITFKR